MNAEISNRASRFFWHFWEKWGNFTKKWNVTANYSMKFFRTLSLHNVIKIIWTWFEAVTLNSYSFSGEMFSVTLKAVSFVVPTKIQARLLRFLNSTCKKIFLISVRIAQLVTYRLGSRVVPSWNPGKGENFSVIISNWIVQIGIQI